MKKTPSRILIADDEADFRSVIAEHLEDLGYRVFLARTGEEALQKAEKQSFDVALLDLRMPPPAGMQLFQRLREGDPELQAIVVTGHGSVESALKAMKQGAHDYLLKPCRLAELEAAVAGALEKRQLRRERDRLQEQLRRQEPPSELLGVSQALAETRELLLRVAPTDSTVLLLGESGTGKELAARSLHKNSPRRNGPFVVFNAGALPENLVESELFGHVKGAFTGSASSRKGLLASAHEGTLFLDEVAEMPLQAQVALLRALETRRFRPVGGEQELHVDVRFVAATHRDLQAMARERSFREDLFFRLNVFSVHLPPLRTRLEDLPLLVEHFFQSRNPGRHLEAPLSSGVLEALSHYSWPGNVRELFNVLERASILSFGAIGLEHLPREIQPPKVQSPAPLSFVPTPPTSWSLQEMERQHIQAVLQHTQGNKVEASRLLEIPRRTLYRKLKRLGLQKD